MKMDQVREHCSVDDCWVVIHGKVYDLTEFSKVHPGGSEIITRFAGKDATKPFSEIHPKDLAERLLQDRFKIGEVESSSILESDVAEGIKKSKTSIAKYKFPPLSQIVNSFDFENVARHKMDAEGWGYYSSGAEDEITLRENRAVFQRIWFIPRVLVDVSTVNLESRICGMKSSLPLYITATALGRLADEQGELSIVRAAYKCGVPYMLPTLSSFSVDEMLDAAHEDQILFGQIYVNKDRKKTIEYIQHLERRGVKAIFITVDAPQLGRREKDMRNKFKTQGSNVQEEGTFDRSQGVARAISSFIDNSLDWKGLQEIMNNTTVPLYLKGVQSVQDAVLAFSKGVNGIVLSNHGGRQLDLTRSAMEILPQVMSALRKLPTYSKSNFEVLIDGGIRRGPDVYKALALGASAVGVGRPVLYALAGYGEKGIEHLFNNVFAPELESCMQLMGTTKVQEITEDSVSVQNIGVHTGASLKDNLQETVYEELKPIKVAKL